MKRYKLIKNENNYSHYVKGIVYNEYYRIDLHCLTVRQCVERYPEDWEEVK